MSATGIYEPLPTGNHIRVLSLLPGKKLATIRCSLTAVPLTKIADNAQQYEALSYVWGTDEPTNMIELNGRPYAIRNNLFTALQILRSKRRPRTLWIDVLCINQLDLAERGSQVAIMSDVYRKAKSVLAWLGEEDDDTRRLFDVLSHHEGDVSKIYAMERRESLNQDVHRKWLHGLQHCGFADFANALDDFLRRPYWSRVWIIQEILSAASVILLCGSGALPANNMAATFVALDRFTEFQYLAPPGYKIMKRYHEYHRGRRDTSLAGLVELCCDCKSECEDPRDKIYGVLSLADDHYNIVPNYEKSVFDLFLELVSMECMDISESSMRQLRQLLEPYPLARVVCDDDELYSNVCERLLKVTGGLLNRMIKGGTIAIHPTSFIVDAYEFRNHPSARKSTSPRPLLPQMWSSALLPRETMLRSSPQAPPSLRLKNRTEDLEFCCYAHENLASHHAGVQDWMRLAYFKDRVPKIFKPHPLLSIEDDPTSAASGWNKTSRFQIWDEALIDLDWHHQDVAIFNTTFLTVDGATGLAFMQMPQTGNPRLTTGDILCHLEGSEGEFTIIRSLEQDGKFVFLGTALLFDRNKGRGFGSFRVNRNL